MNRRIRQLYRPLRRRPLRVALLLTALLACLLVSGAAEAGLRLVEPQRQAYAVSMLSALSADYQPWPVGTLRQAELDSAVIVEAARDEILRRAAPDPEQRSLVPLDLPPLPQAALPGPNGSIALVITPTPETPEAATETATEQPTAEIAGTATVRTDTAAAVEPPAFPSATPAPTADPTETTPASDAQPVAPTSEALPPIAVPQPNQPVSSPIAAPPAPEPPVEPQPDTAIPAPLEPLPTDVPPPTPAPEPTATPPPPTAVPPPPTAVPPPPTAVPPPPTAVPPPPTAVPPPPTAVPPPPTAVPPPPTAVPPPPTATPSITPVSLPTTAPQLPPTLPPTATPSNTPVPTVPPTATPTLEPLPTEPPTVTPEPPTLEPPSATPEPPTLEPPTATPEPPTATPEPPTPTPSLQPLIVLITEPGAGANITDIGATTFGAIAYDPDIGTGNGQGISQVLFQLLDAGGTAIASRTENQAAYCLFGGDTSCSTMPPGQWSNLTPGVYTLIVEARSSTGKPSVSVSVTFTMP